MSNECHCGHCHYEAAQAMTLGDAPSVKRLRYAELRLWFEGRNPLTDVPDETVGVMQDSLEATQQFADAVLAVHFHGECGCQALATGACDCPVVALRARAKEEGA